MSDFDRRLETGRVAEGLIAQWLMSKGNAVMPAYQIEQHTGKGPQLFCFDRELVAPDMLVFNHRGITWVESKHKSVFSWHYKTKRWTTGIDLRHYGEYLRVTQKTKLPVWLLFFHREETPTIDDRKRGCPTQCPTGLFGAELFSLVEIENHRALPFDPSRTGMVGHGRSGMVYWSADDLRRLATKDEVLSASESLRLS